MAVQNNKAEGTVLLEMKHVKKSFDKSGVLKDISLKVREGQVVSIIGPSGSGKSALCCNQAPVLPRTVHLAWILYQNDKFLQNMLHN